MTRANCWSSVADRRQVKVLPAVSPGALDE